MADQQQLDLLRQGVTDWHVWRTQHPDIQPNLSGAQLSGADLGKAHLSAANLSEANLTYTNLSSADLSEANLRYANLSGANLTYADLSEAQVGLTIFGSVDLRTVKGLETVRHFSPSIIGTDTLLR